MWRVPNQPLLPRGPLEDVLADQPQLSTADDRRDAEAQLETLFLTAQDQVNAYQAERLREVFELAERAVALGSAFPVSEPEERDGSFSWITDVPKWASRYGAGILLAACAPLVANDSVTLAVLAGVGAALSLVSALRPHDTDKMARPKPKAVEARFKGLVSAADRALLSMTAPRALTQAAGPATPLPHDDVMAFLQDAAMAEGSEEADELRSNAERMISRAGYRVVREGSPDLFETMVDPDVTAPLLLKPALVHRHDGNKTIFGVMVRGQGV